MALVRDSTLYYIYTDHLNTPRAITDISNNLQWTWENKEAFGNNSPTEVVTGFKFNFRLPGQYFDSETNLNYNIHRDYNPVWGRYMSSDPLGLAAGINTYGYVSGNSLTFIDKDGKVPILVPILLGVALNATNVYSSGNKSTQQVVVGAIIGGAAGAAAGGVAVLELGFWAASASYGLVNVAAGMANRVFADTKSDPNFTTDVLINFSAGAIAGGSCAVIGKYMGSAPIANRNLSLPQTGQIIGGELGSLNGTLFLNTTINYKDTLAGQP